MVLQRHDSDTSRQIGIRDPRCGIRTVRLRVTAILLADSGAQHLSKSYRSTRQELQCDGAVVRGRNGGAMVSIVSFRDLDAWNAAMDLTVTTYGLCRRFPRDEQYGLVQQMRRAAVSVPSNIAEGHANGPGLRYRHHVRIALGSLAELATQVEIAMRLNYVDADTAKEAATELARARQLLHGLHRSLNRQLLTRPLPLVVLLGWAFAIAALLS